MTLLYTMSCFSLAVIGYKIVFAIEIVRTTEIFPLLAIYLLLLNEGVANAI